MSDLLSAASFLLAVAGVLYGLWYKEISDALETAVPDHAANRVKPRKGVGRVIWTRALPMTLASLTVGLVFLPPALSIVSASLRSYSTHRFGYLHAYDPNRTAFCVVVLFALALGMHSGLRLVRLLHLWITLSRK